MMYKENSWGGRNSSVEFLRIIAMFAILYWHTIHHGLLQIKELNDTNRFVLECFHWGLLWHVDVFLLITGYFGINLRFKSFLSLVLKLIAVTLLIYCVFGFIAGGINLYNLVVAVKNNMFGGIWWFMQFYIQLMLLSPALNVLKSFDDRKFLLFFALLVFINIFMGFILKVNFNSDGFNLNHFIFMYYIGYAIHRFQERIVVQNFFLLCLLFLSITMNVVIAFLSNERIYTYCYAYNNPFVVLNAICIFILFKQLVFQNRFINWIASSTLMVYLLTDEGIYSRPLLAKLSQNLYYMNFGDMFSTLIELFLISSVIFFFCIIVDKLINFAIIHIVIYLSHYWNKVKTKYFRMLLKSI